MEKRDKCMSIKSWNDYFLDLAKTCSSRSNCLRAQVGAVIVGQDKKLKLQAIMVPRPELNRAMNAVNATELKTIFHQEPVMKHAVQSMLNKMLLFKPDKTDAQALQCISTDIISSVFYVNDLLYKRE